jgi:Sigma-54 interaction domain.
MPATHPQLLVHAGERVAADPSVLDSLRGALPEGAHADWLRPAPVAVGDAGTAPIQADFVLSLFVDPQELDGVSDRVNLTRRSGRSTTLVVAVRPTQLAALGRWLERRANAGQLHGLRLLMATSLEEVVQRLPERLEPASEENVIRMPVSAEVENSPVRHFYVFSPQIQALIKRIRGFAQNGINRAYLLGGPGSGKTTLSYYYFLLRNRGRYVSVNLAAENTGDKAAVKSLLCGHVSGAFPGAGARTGAFHPCP